MGEGYPPKEQAADEVGKGEPVADHEHVLSADCWCGPVVEEVPGPARDPRPYRDGYEETPVALENPVPMSEWSKDEPTPGEREWVTGS